MQLQTHRHCGDPLVQAADPRPQLLLQQGSVWTPEQALQRKDLPVQLPHPSWQCLPAPQEGQSSRQGQIQVLHEHAEGQPGDLCQPGGQRSAQLESIAFNTSDVLPILLGLKWINLALMKVGGAQASLFINYPQGRDNKAEHFFPLLCSRWALACE